MVTQTPSPGRGRGGRRGRGRGRGRGGHLDGNTNRNNGTRSPTSSSNGSARSSPARKDVETKSSSISNDSTNVHTGNDDARSKIESMTEQQVLVAFGPFVRAGNSNALNIHQMYLANHNQSEFLRNAREFLIGQEDSSKATSGAPGEESVAAVVTVKEKKPVTHHVSPPPGILPPPGLSLPNQNNVPPNMQQQAAPPKAVPQSPPATASTNPAPSTTTILPSPNKTPKTESKETPAAPKIKVRRVQTRLNEQPGKIFANGIAAGMVNNGKVASLTVRLRCELSARWVLPLKFLRERMLRLLSEKGGASAAQNLTIRDALKCLTVGLFRYGIPDNGANCSIVSKEILSPEGKDYPFDIDSATDSIYGTVPFYSPRTPGNVVFRMYFEDEPAETLATGPCVKVVPDEEDYASVLRFILSNFKSKKSNGLSSIHSFASVLESFSPKEYVHNSNSLEEAGRAGWGCICETRKLVETAYVSYEKKKVQLEEQRRELEEAERVKAELPEIGRLDLGGEKASGEEKDEAGGFDKVFADKAKLASDEYMNEKKWKEIQHAYTMLLEAVLNNEAAHLIFKRDSLQKMRLEYELWCPLCESFAPNPLATTSEDTTDQHISFLVQSIKNGQTKLFVDNRRKMQMEVLGFIPNMDKVPWVARAAGKNNKLKPGSDGTVVFQELSEAMNRLYVDKYQVSEHVHNRRERVRAGIEKVVTMSGAFPSGTRVTVFGSSANGFGAPSSDLDLCLQVPQSATDFSKEDGVDAMTKLAEKFTEEGMTDVNTERLTARIPIVKFNFPYSENGSNVLVECDLSLQNPLACLNTTLLNTYSKMSPDTCILASIIKRWAKSRDINNPSMHTLSSYGYVLMLLYYLTSSEASSDGFVVDPGHGTGSDPILLNLQHVDPSWAQNPIGPYREMLSKPVNQYCTAQHPTEPNFLVNTYFYRSGLDNLQNYYADRKSTGPCLGVLLASFFRYFAYEFDYKKYIVSLDTRHGEAKEKELKAEEDGWSLFKPGLAIEDPFEHFYDVAHVVKTSNFHTIQREFALAYTKIVNAVYGTGISGKDLIDLICEPVADN